MTEPSIPVASLVSAWRFARRVLSHFLANKGLYFATSNHEVDAAQRDSCAELLANSTHDEQSSVILIYSVSHVANSLGKKSDTSRSFMFYTSAHRDASDSGSVCYPQEEDSGCDAFSSRRFVPVVRIFRWVYHTLKERRLTFSHLSIRVT